MTVTIPQSEIDRFKSRFVLKTHTVPRPSRRDDDYADLSDRQLAAMQFAYDQAKEADTRRQDMAAQSVARRATEEAQQRAQQRERAAQARAAADSKILEPAWTAFQASGGTRDEFEASKEEILRAARLKAATDAATGATDKMQPRPMNPARF